MALTLHHIGYLTDDLGRMADSLGRRYGYLPVAPPVYDERQTVWVQFLAGPTRLELIQPEGRTSKVFRALRAGVTLHHLCYATDNLDRDGTRLRRDGMLELYRGPAVAFPGQTIAWYAGTGGQLVELLA